MRPLLYALVAWIIIGAVAFITVDKLAMPLISGRFKGTVTVSNYLAKAPDQAGQELTGSNLIPMIDSVGEFSPEIAAGLIVNQRPLPETIVKEGRRVWFTISKGLNSVKLPDFQGLSLRQAEISLQQLDLVLDSIVSVSQASFPAGMVINTQPKAGTEVPVRSSVTVFLSKSKKKETLVRRYVGMPMSRVTKLIVSAEMTLGNVQYKKDLKTLPNTVIRQDPKAGSLVKKGMPVHLIISKR